MRPRFPQAVLVLVLVGAHWFAMTGMAQAAPRTQVINNPAPNPDAPSFRVSEPILRIGGLNDDERYELLGVVEADLTASGGLVVAPYAGARAARATEVRVFDAAGKFVRRFGTRGQGPGEYQTISNFVVLPRDSMLIVDNTQHRVTLVDAAGNVAGTSAFPDMGICCFSDGSYLAGGRLSQAGSTQRAKVPYWLATVMASRSASGSAQRGTSAAPAPGTPGKEIVTVDGSDPPLRFGPFPGDPGEMTYSLFPLPFGRTAHVAVTAQEIVYGINDSFELRVYSKNGALLRTVRSSAPPRPVTPQELDEQRAGLMRRATTAARRPVYTRILDAAVFPKTHPAYREIEVERDGTVWVLGYPAPPDTSVGSWWARFDPSGKLLGTVRMPATMGVVRFARGHVILSKRDIENGTVYLSVHRIEPTGRVA